VWGCVFDDQHGLRSRDAVGLEHILFETDYPHTDGTWPESRGVAHRLCEGAGMNAQECYEFLRGNAIRCYGLERFGITARRAAFVRELSTGTRRVLDLACVTAAEPRVLLLDEPSAGIARAETDALAPLLRNLRDEQGVTLVVIEHDLTLLQAVCERVIALDVGAIIAEGAPDDDRPPAKEQGCGGEHAQAAGLPAAHRPAHATSCAHSRRQGSAE